MHENGIAIEGWYPLGGRGYTAAMLGNETIGQIAKAHGKSPAQIILRWDLQNGIVIIPGSVIPTIREKTYPYSISSCHPRKWHKSPLLTETKNMIGIKTTINEDCTSIFERVYK